ncbi:MAG: hypothetical protein ABIE70_05970 [bacterium]
MSHPTIQLGLVSHPSAVRGPEKTLHAGFLPVLSHMEQVQEITADRLITCNERRCHNTLGDLPPTIFREQQTAGNSTCELST